MIYRVYLHLRLKGPSISTPVPLNYFRGRFLEEAGRAKMRQHCASRSHRMA